jgi:hypothetical protein
VGQGAFEELGLQDRIPERRAERAVVGQGSDRGQRT